MVAVSMLTDRDTCIGNDLVQDLLLISMVTHSFVFEIGLSCIVVLLKRARVNFYLVGLKGIAFKGS